MARSVQFNDGKIAVRREARADIRDDVLHITAREGHSLATWTLADIRYVERNQHTPPLRFRHAKSNERLTLGSDDDGGWLTTHCTNLGKRDRGAIKWPTWVAAGILAAASVAGIFVYLLPAASGTIVGLIPTALEQRIGAESRDQLLSFFGRLQKTDDALVCDAPGAQAILNKRADELATVMNSPFPVRVTVVRFPGVNALTLPGGEVIILSGLLDKAESGDAVIGILAHEIAHTVRRDPLQVSIKKTGAALMVSLLVGDVFGGAALGGLASGLIESGYSRDAEAAADFIAVTALNQLGLTAIPLADFVAGIEKDNPMAGVIPPFLNTHPGGTDRRRDIRALSQGHGRAMSSYDWKIVKNMCR